MPSSPNPHFPPVRIIGCGVIGLTTAIYLQERGFPVQILTRDLPAQTTSAKAAAIWFPFAVSPWEQVKRWSLQTYHEFSELAQDQQSGVSMIPFTVLALHPQPPDWLEAMPSQAVGPAPSQALPRGYEFGWMAEVPLIEAPLYLEYLLTRFKAGGGQILQRTIQHFQEVQKPNEILINCTGLGAKTLLHDPLLYPLQGQLVKLAPQGPINCIADDDGPNALAYIIPRKDAVILGGTALAHASDLNPQPSISQAIRQRCQQLDSRVQDLPFLESWVGLRPARASIRLEREATTGIFHNYGHGGGGYTVSWGCAAAIYELIGQSYPALARFFA
ncbi:MAG: FAD-dependent oxidoreductase [Bacteroidota bacterium]